MNAISSINSHSHAVYQPKLPKLNSVSHKIYKNLYVEKNENKADFRESGDLSELHEASGHMCCLQTDEESPCIFK